MCTANVTTLINSNIKILYVPGAVLLLCSVPLERERVHREASCDSDNTPPAPGDTGLG